MLRAKIIFGRFTGWVVNANFKMLTIMIQYLIMMEDSPRQTMATINRRVVVARAWTAIESTTIHYFFRKMITERCYTI